MEDERIPVSMALICRTEGCENNGIPIIFPYEAEMSGATCGPCEQEITDIEYLYEEEE